MRFIDIDGFEVGDRVIYVGPDKGGPTCGNIGKIVFIDPDWPTSVEDETEGEKLYVVEFAKSEGDMYVYEDSYGHRYTTGGHGWACAESYLRLLKEGEQIEI